MQKKARWIKSNPFFKARFQNSPSNVQPLAGSTGASAKAAKTLLADKWWIVAMSKRGHTSLGTKCKASSTSLVGKPSRVLLILPASLLLIASTGVFAATKNAEAVAPQRTNQTPVRANPAPTQPIVRSVPIVSSAPRVAPKQVLTATPTSPSVTRPVARPITAPVAAPSRAPVAQTANSVRRVSVPVLGREGPAAVAAATNVRQIAITASEPQLTSSVRPSDVASFQKIGAPYQVAGTWYVPAHEPDYDETGVASWYGNEFHGKPTANGEIFDMNMVSGAHPTLPIPSLVEVTNLANGRSIIVRINDRGPFVGSRLIDMSSRGAELLGFRVRYVGPADAEPRVSAQTLTAPIRVAGSVATKPLGVTAIEAPLPSQPTQVATSTPAQSTPSQSGQSQQAFVQVGAFSVLANAERLRDQTAGLGPVQVVEATNGEGNLLYRVVLGPVANRAEALAKVEEMTNSGITSARVMASLN
jgi:rare lipoprotein A